MPTALQDLESARIEMEGLFGEVMSLNGTDYPILIPNEGLAQGIRQGGFTEDIRMSVSIRKSLFAPSFDPKTLIGQKPTVRGQLWRIFDSAPNLVTFELSLETTKK